MIVGVVTDFEMTFTGYLFKIACQNNYFVFKVSLPQKKKHWQWFTIKIQVSNSGSSWQSCSPFFSQKVFKTVKFAGTTVDALPTPDGSIVITVIGQLKV